MKQVDEMPTSGQFVAVWEYGGKLFSETKLIDDYGYALTMNTETGEFIDQGLCKYPDSVKYFIAE